MPRPLQQHTTLKSGCKARRKMLLIWRWEMVMWVIMGLSRGMLIFNMWVEVEDGVKGKVPHDYQEMHPVDLPLQEEGVLIKEATGVPFSQPWWGGLEKVDRYFLLLRLGQPTLAAVHLPVITRVLWRPCQEFRQGCCPNQHLTVIGGALWHGNDIEHP